MTHTEARELANQFGTRMCDENGHTHNQELYCFDLDDIIALKEALAQPEQEPIRVPWSQALESVWAEQEQALCDLAEDGVCETLDCPNHPIEQEPVATLLLQSKQNYERNFGPSAAADWIYSDLLELLDTTPPQRTWRGLTDEQYFEIGQRHWLPSSKIARIHKEIEKAAHGIKENT